MAPVRLLLLAIHATTERRASDHPPPTASRTRLCGRIEECVFARLNRSKDASSGRGISEGATHAKSAGDGKIPCLLGRHWAAGDPDVGRATGRSARNQAGPGRAKMENPVADDFLEANKALRILKLHKDIWLHFTGPSDAGESASAHQGLPLARESAERVSGCTVDRF